MTDESVTGHIRISEAPDTIAAQGIVVEKARAAGLGAGLADNDLYQALRAVREAEPSRRQGILERGPLWAHFALKGLQAARAVVEILEFFGYEPDL